jgi:plastocyanin
MKKSSHRLHYLLPLMLILITLVGLSACSTYNTSTPAPSITITAPTGNIIPQIGDVTVSVQVSNFTLVDKLSRANVPGEGHIHYFMDVDAPTIPGEPAVTAAGTYAATAATSYTWHNVGGGPHKFSVELVNNDHTPLTPPVVATVTVTVLPEIGPPSVVITTPKDGSTIPTGNVTVSIQVSNFNVVDEQGQANASHEGHIHYFLDVDAPTTPGEAAIPTSGTWAHVADTTYTFGNVAAGTHTISVELVNNDHTPLTPPVVAKVTFTVQAATTTPTPGQSVTISLIAQKMSFDKSTITVPADANVTIDFNNKDSIPHNFALYTDSSARTSIFVGQIITSTTTTYKFTAPSTPGNYFFRCDVHPTIMTGTFVVQ